MAVFHFIKSVANNYTFTNLLLNHDAQVASDADIPRLTVPKNIEKID